MDRAPVTEFGGIVGRVVHEAMSLGTLLTGVCLGVVLLAGAFFLMQFEMEVAANLFVPALVALAMARFALNGMWGEYSGTIFSTVGGTWPQAVSVAGRYLTLNTVWILPVTILGIGFGEHAAGAASVLELVSSGQLVALIILYLTGAALAPPVFLIVSVRAKGYADLIRIEHWTGLFAGRLGDLYAVYTIYLGGLSMAMLLSLPVLIVAFASSVNTGLFLSSVVLAFSGGLGITLLGRLCGFYAFGGEEQALASAPPPPVPGAAQRGPGPRPAPALAHGPAARTAPAQPIRTSAPVPGREPGPAAPKAAPPGPLAARPASPPAAAAGMAPAAAAAPAGKPPLMDAQRRVDEARQRFEQDREAGIRLLEELREQYAPGPQVLHALVMARQLAGQTDKAVEAAREAFPLCFQRGNIVLAAEMFRALWKQLQALRFNRDQILAIGGALVKMGDLKYATSTYAVVIRMDAGEKRAIKGLLQIADLNLQPGGAADEAVKIYKYLLQNCPNSTFELDIRDRLSDAERRLARAT